MNEFYVYVYLDPRKPGNYEYESICFLYEPFYIGKGTGRRYKVHLCDAKKEHHNDCNNVKINKIRSILRNNYEPIIYFYDTNMLECEALTQEKILISQIGTLQLVENVGRRMFDKLDITVGKLVTLDIDGLTISSKSLKIVKHVKKHMKN